ncbi:glycosyltransferase family 4 protein [bacterium]|nr:glycosyltransferase family 4 protein [bacterium]
MLTTAGYTPKVCVAEGFVPIEAYALDGVTLFEIPKVRVTNNASSAKDETFKEDIEALYDSYLAGLEGVDVVITHDLVYTPDNVKHQIAARKVAEKRPDIKWLHWIHSATTPHILIQERRYYEDEYMAMIGVMFPNSYYVFFNDWSKRRIAANFRVPVDRVKTVYHPTDVQEFLGIGGLTQEIITKGNLLSADLITTYPIRMDRGKQPSIVLEMMIRLRNEGFSTKCVIVDFASSSKDPNDDKFKLRQELKDMANDWAYSDDLIFTSEVSPEMSYSVPHSVIRDLMLLSDIFVIASRSESYSLVTQEAILAKNLVILNDDFPPFKEIFGDNLSIRIGSAVNRDTGLDGESTPNYMPSREAYMEAITKEIIAKIYANGLIMTHSKIRKERNLDYVWKHQLEPLIEGGDSAKRFGSTTTTLPDVDIIAAMDTLSNS